MQLLQDIFIIEQLQVLSEGKTDGPMKIRGVFGRCNEKNNNGRIYPTAVLESQLSKVQPLINERRLCGELDHPQNDTVKLSNASHLITKLDMKGNELIGEAEILKTPAGLTAKALVEGGVKIGISSRGMGTLSEDHNGDKIVNEDFRLVTFDLVADPSTRGAFPGLSESTESQFVKESQTKLQKESNFVTMLESKMRDAYQPWVDESRESKKTRAARERAEAEAAKEAKKEDAQTNTDDVRRNPQQTLKAEAFERVKAEGSYHRIAYTLADVLGHDISERKKNLPGNQEAIDADGDGKIEASDFKKLRSRKKKVNEAFADELDKEGQRSLAPANPAADQGGMMANFRARRHAKGMEVAASKGRAKGKGIEAKGDIKRARMMDKAKAAAAAGGPVTAGEKVAAAAGRAGGALAGGAKALAAAPGKAVDRAVAVSDAASKAKRQNRLDRAARGSARERIAARAAAGGPQNAPTPAPQQTKKPGISDEEKYQRKALGQAAQKKAEAGVASRAQAGAEGKFGAGVGRSDKEAQRKAIARRERKTGKKINLTPQQQVDLSHTSYKQIGNIIAEMFYVREDAEKGYAGIKGGTPEAAAKERKLKSGEYGRTGYGGGARKKTAPVTQDETKDKREQGSTRA
jgi:hypothetical protein